MRGWVTTAHCLLLTLRRGGGGPQPKVRYNAWFCLLDLIICLVGKETIKEVELVCMQFKPLLVPHS